MSKKGCNSNGIGGFLDGLFNNNDVLAFLLFLILILLVLGFN
jgi:hypothetical protein